ncbi:MAG: hypothetical protein A2Y17_11865 [Clostridiales bacterium GWF2_38_85]|nr:MAG: hypothetical protein A2Y17_11865 [Clostridiales bacterium GWF2_38_85]HBL85398.1 hypothetical protein [Clostridiales bacterium]
MADRLKYKRKLVSNEIIRRQRDHKKLRRRVFYVSLVVFVNVVFFSLVFLVLLKIRNITTEGNQRYSAEQIIEALPVEKGDNMYNFFTADVENTVKSELPYITSLEITRKLPSTLELSVVEKNASMYIELNSEYFLLSEDLLVLEMTGNREMVNQLPELVSTNIKKCVVGKYIVFRDEATLDVLKILNKTIISNFESGRITEVDVSSRFDIWLRYENRFIIYLGDIQNCDLKIRFLGKIIDELYEDQSGRIDVSNIARGSFKEGVLEKTT